MSGRLGAILGHKNVAMAAGLWWVIFTFASGYTDDFVSLCIMRGLTGIGGGMLVPNTLALLTINFPPGKMRNITVACFGAMAPIGAAGGSVFPGFFVQLLPWKWLFFFLWVTFLVEYRILTGSQSNAWCCYLHPFRYHRAQRGYTIRQRRPF